jgi:hypothetical protein
MRIGWVLNALAGDRQAAAGTDTGADVVKTADATAEGVQDDAEAPEWQEGDFDDDEDLVALQQQSWVRKLHCPAEACI